MNKRYLEIVQLDNGDIILRDEKADNGEEERDWRPTVIRAASENEDAIIRLRFTPALLERLGDDVIEVAAAMCQAGADAAAALHKTHTGETISGWSLLAQYRSGDVH